MTSAVLASVWPRLGHKAEVSASATFRDSAFDLGYEAISLGSSRLDVMLFALTGVQAERLASGPLATAWPKPKFRPQHRPGNNSSILDLQLLAFTSKLKFWPRVVLRPEFGLRSFGLRLAMAWPQSRSFRLSLGLVTVVSASGCSFWP